MIRSNKTSLVLFTLALLFAAGCQKADSQEISESNEWLDYQGEESKPYVVLVAGDEEYRSEEALPMLAGILNEHHGFNCRVVFSQDPDKPGISDPNYSFNIPGLDALDDADLMIIFTRFRALNDDQMTMINRYLESGKPVIGIRTATHAFHFKEDVETNFRHYGNYHQSEDEWNGGFGRLVLGEKWINHHGSHGNQSTRGMIASGAEDHPVLKSIADGAIWGPTDVYGVRLPLPNDSQVLVLGRTVDREGEKDENDPLLGMRSTDSKEPEKVTRKIGDKEAEIELNNPMMPIIWTKSYQLPGGIKGRSLTTTIGSSTDMLNEDLRRLLVNATYWLTDQQVPENANVSFTKEYTPSRFAFHDDAHWDAKNIVITGLK